MVVMSVATGGTQRRFPVEELRPVSASFGGSLVFNPFAQLPPSLWYGVEIDLDAIELGHAGATEALETQLIFGGIVLPQRDWREISGSIGPVDDQGESSIYVDDVHTPIELHRVAFERVDGIQFLIELDFTIDFESEELAYDNARTQISVQADYQGLFFHEPVFADPSAVKIPREWNVPDRFDTSTVRAFFERFVDTRRYAIEQQDQGYELRPV